MAIVAVLSITLYASFNIMTSAKKRAEATVRPTRAVAVAMELIAQDLENAVIPSTVTDRLVLFGGLLGAHEGGVGTEADWVELHTMGNDGTPNAGPMSEGVRRVDWGVITEGNTNVLVRSVTRNLLAPVEVAPTPQVICRNVRAFALRYFDGYTWYDQWDSTLTATPLPLVVQVDLTVTVPDPRGGDLREPEVYHVSRLISIPAAKLVADAAI
jgi:hypothetical protein